MRRVVLFLVLAGLGWVVLVRFAGGMAGPRRTEEGTPVALRTTPTEAVAGPGTTVNVDAMPLGASRPRDPPRVDLAPMGAFVTSVTKSFRWVDPVTAETIDLPHYVTLSLRMDGPTPEPSPTQGVPWFRWRGVNVVAYREPSTLSRSEVNALLADPATRRNLVLYDLDADEGSANINPQAVAEGGKPLPPRFVLRLTKDVRVHVVPDDVRLRAANVVVDQAAEALEGAGDVLASGPGFTASGTGLRVDKRTGRVEILRNVTYRAEQRTTDRAARPGATPLGGVTQPRLVRSRGPFLLVRHDTPSGKSTYESVLTEDVEVETADGGRLTAQRVVLEAVPDDDARSETPARAEAPLSAGARRYRLRSLVAETLVRIRSEEGAGASARTVAVETDRLTARADDPTRPSAVLEGRTVLTYHGTLPVPGGAERLGTVTARCRDRLTYGPAPKGSETRPDDVVVELVGAVEVEGAALPGESSQRLTADRLRWILRPADPVSALPRAGATPAARPGHDLVAVAFHASGDEVRILGPLVSGRAREIEASGLDRPDGWRLSLLGPDAHIEVDERAAPAGTDPRGATQGPASSDAARRAWVVDDVDASGGVRGALAPRPDDAPVRFEAATLRYRETEGGELRGGPRGNARLLYAARAGQEQQLEAPLVGFSLGEAASRLWTRGGTSAVVWTSPPPDDGGGRPGRRSFVLRGRSGIEASAGRTASADPSVSVRVREAASVETLYDGVGGDRLEAGTLTVLLVERLGGRAFASPWRRPAATGTASTAGTAAGRSIAKPAIAKPAPAKPPTATAPPPKQAAGPLATAPTRWSLACADLDVALSGRGEGLASLLGFTATGGVVAFTDPQDDGSRQRFEGREFTLQADGPRHRGRLSGTPDERARLEASAEDLPRLAQWIASPDVSFVLEGATLLRAEFAAPTSARMHHRLDGRSLFDGLSGAGGSPASPSPKDTGKGEAPPAVERLALRVDAGPLTLVRGDDGLTTVTAVGAEAAPVVLARSVRLPGRAEFDAPIKLASPRIVLHVRDLFGTDAVPERFEARGPGTRLEIPSEEGTILAAGQDLVYDRDTAMLRLDGPNGVVVTRPGVLLHGTFFSYNLRTGARDVGAPQLEAAR